MASLVHCYRNMEQSDCVVVCGWSYLLNLQHLGQHTGVHKEKVENSH